MATLSKKAAARIAELVNQMQASIHMKDAARAEPGKYDYEAFAKRADEAVMALATEFGIYLPTLSLAYDSGRVADCLLSLDMSAEIRRQRRLFAS